jgi:hypothetical protein
MVYKCHFQKRENKSPYFYLDSNGIFNNVLDIIIKLVLVAKENNLYLDGQQIRLEWKYIKDGKLTTFYYDKQSNFIDEIRVQQIIAKKGLQILHRNTPIIVYSDILSKSSQNYTKITQLLLKKIKEKAQILQMFSEFDKISRIKEREPLFRFNDFYFGIIGMEYIGPPYILCNTLVRPIVLSLLKKENTIHKYDCRTLASKSDQLRWIYNIRRYELLRLAVDTGYSQGDYHTENIMVDETNRRAMILDFGTAKHIENHPQINSLWSHLKKDDFMNKEENLVVIGKILEEIYSVHFINVTKEFTEYKWIKEIDEEDCQQIVIIDREQSENKEVDLFQFYFQNQKYG